MWCGTSLMRNGTWCVPTASTTRPGASWTRPRTGSGCGSAAQVLLQPADVGGQPAVFLGRLADGGRACRPDHAEQQRGVDRPRGDVGVPVPARAELIA